jgi:hypothetical protein
MIRPGKTHAAIKDIIPDVRNFHFKHGKPCLFHQVKKQIVGKGPFREYMIKSYEYGLSFQRADKDGYYHFFSKRPEHHGISLIGLGDGPNLGLYHIMFIIHVFHNGSPLTN